MAFMDETTELEVEKNKAIRGYIVRALARATTGPCWFDRSSTRSWRTTSL